LILYISGYEAGMRQTQAPGAAASTAAPAASTAAPAATSTGSSKLAQMVGLGIEPQAIVIACGSTPDTVVFDVIKTNASKTTSP
jgi:hypothetical protein